MLGCLLITTNVSSRLSLFDDAFESAEALKIPFTQKVISVDIFEGEPTPLSFFKRAGWELVCGPCSRRRGLFMNQRRGMNAMRTDWVLYMEDDIVLHRFFDPSILDPPRFVVFNTHVNESPNIALEYINNSQHYIKIGSEMFLHKNTSLKDQYFLNFPVACGKREWFLALQEYAQEHCQGLGVEPAMTKAWFGLNFEHDVLIFVKPDVLTRLPFSSVEEFHKEANMSFWNNDPTLRHPSINDRNNSFV